MIESNPAAAHFKRSGFIASRAGILTPGKLFRVILPYTTAASVIIQNMPENSFRRAGNAWIVHVPTLAFFVAVIVLILVLAGCDLSPIDTTDKQKLPTPTPLATLGTIVNLDDSDQTPG